MISPRTALRRVLLCCAPLSARQVHLDDALGRVLAEDVRSRIALPSFDNSAMDGYAVRSRDTARATARRPARLRITGAIHAGDAASRAVHAGEAIAVTTGAEIPPGADAVLPIEDARVDGTDLVVVSAVARGRYVRRRGEEIRPGAKVLSRGSVLHAGAIGCLAAVGRSRVRAVRPPRVAVITTGDETVLPGRALARGRVYDSNFVMLGALLRQAGIVPARMRRVRDDPGALSRAVADALADSDVVVTVGGVSVGARDYVRSALRGLGVREVFWRVRQQPGQPLYFGRRGRRLVFGLPGNPASAFACFCLYVLPALRALGGHGVQAPSLERRVLRNAVRMDSWRWRLLKARAAGGSSSRVEVLAQQGSHMATPLAHTSHLVIVPPRSRGAGRAELPAGSEVTCLRLPHAGEAPR